MLEDFFLINTLVQLKSPIKLFCTLIKRALTFRGVQISERQSKSDNGSAEGRPNPRRGGGSRIQIRWSTGAKSVTHMQGIYCGKCKIIAEPLFAFITTIIIVILEDITIPLQQLRNILQLLEIARSSGLK